MKPSFIRPTLVALVLVSLAGCAGNETQPPEPPVYSSVSWPASPASFSEMERVHPAFSSVDEYKVVNARHVMLANEGHTFSGKLPRMLPAVVVLRITVDETGALRDMFVQRPPSHDEGESEIAMASVRRAGLLPRPHNLSTGPRRMFSFSETFLFNSEMRFQIRTLAPIQTSD